MKNVFLPLLLLLLLLVATTCKKNIPVDDNGDKDPVTDTVSGNNNHEGNETTDTTTTHNDDPGNEVTDTTGSHNNQDDTISDPGNQPVDTLSNPGGNSDTIVAPVNRKDTVTLTFRYGENGPSPDYKNIYVVWLEAPGFIQNIYICRKLIAGGLTGTALPYWKMNKYPLCPADEIDAVTGATKGNCDFTLTAVIGDSSLKKVTINFETDRSFDPNDWFGNQPALLYQATLDLEDTTTLYELHPVGWTPNEDTENEVANTPMGKLQEEMGYITQYKKGSGFGEKDPRGATKMVKQLTVTVK